MFGGHTQTLLLAAYCSVAFNKDFSFLMYGKLAYRSFIDGKCFYQTLLIFNQGKIFRKTFILNQVY